MSSLETLVKRINPGLDSSGIESILGYYTAETFEADWAQTRPLVQGDTLDSRGYQRLDSGETIRPNTLVGPFRLSVQGPGRPQFYVDYDVSGKISPKGRMIRVNLFNKRAGWDWTSTTHPKLAESNIRNRPGVKSPVLISIEDGNKHYYCLNYDTGILDGLLYTKARKGEPRNRPSVRGRLVLGKIVGTIITLASKKMHYVYETISTTTADSQGLLPLRMRD
jgi:hypothetical protein